MSGPKSHGARVRVNTPAGVPGVEFRPYVAPKWEPPRPGSMRHLEMPSLAGGQRYYPQRPWAAKDQ